ncbi:ABC transporter substrate-binding protein [Pelagibacterium sp. 26DY04]|uniref:ABC transporter substrate-binding protein n=1 Tax=Pelagibacterium sp. 26DY04 TaxID=2967130 RepID=UPI0028158DC0|nr:ABC transporter substrate-binding protein [Pelagibacterium sp. 26DY04]WMT85993.1 ABC transporter substrate-binding protein [Pelagibacterium sp. 26DY04]
MSIGAHAMLVLAMAVTAAGPVLAQDFPVTIAHAYGETTITEKPERVATWSWGNTDAVLALGVKPVAMPFISYGGGDNGIHPWAEEVLEEMGGELPAILAENDEPPYEQILAAAPDVIIAAHSGITEEQYERLSAIAPTVAFPEVAWSTPWQEVTQMTGAALGLAEEAEALIAETEQFVADAVAAQPGLAGTTFIALNDFDGSLAIYAELDSRVKFLTDLGLVYAPSLEALEPDDGSFYFSVSYENADALVSDILVSYYENEADSDAFFSAPYIARLPQTQAGAYASIVGIEEVAAVSPPSALSLRWGIEDYVAQLAAAAANAQ